MYQSRYSAVVLEYNVIKEYIIIPLMQCCDEELALVKDSERHVKYVVVIEIRGAMYTLIFQW